MKRQLTKLICLVFVIALIFSISSCAVVDMIKDKFHKHDYVDGKCECGESDPDYVTPHTHNFVDGKCECGEEDPNYVPPTKGTADDPHAIEIPGSVKVTLADDGVVYYVFTITENKSLKITVDSDNVSVACDTTAEGLLDKMYDIGEAKVLETDLAAGTYYVAFATADFKADEYTVTAEFVTKVSPYEVVINEGNYNTLTFSAAEIEAGEASRKLIITTASSYMFKGDAFVAKIVAADGSEIAKNADYSYTLAAGEYTVSFGMFSIFQTEADKGIHLNVEDQNKEDVGGDDTDIDITGTYTGTDGFGNSPLTVVIDATSVTFNYNHPMMGPSSATYTYSIVDGAVVLYDEDGNEVNPLGGALTLTNNVPTGASYNGTEYTLTIGGSSEGGEGEGEGSDPIEITTEGYLYDGESEVTITDEQYAAGKVYYAFTPWNEGEYYFSSMDLYVSGVYLNGVALTTNDNGYYVLSQNVQYAVEISCAYVSGAGTYAVNAEYQYPLGHQENPIWLYSLGESITASYPGNYQPVWYQFYASANGTVTVTTENTTATILLTAAIGSEVESVDGTVSLTVMQGRKYYIGVADYSVDENYANPAAEITFTPSITEGDYVGEGSINVPNVLVLGTNTASVPAWSNVYFVYTAAGNGTLTLTTESTNCSWYVTDDLSKWEFSTESTLSIQLYSGEIAYVCVSTADYAAADIVFNASFKADPTEAWYEGTVATDGTANTIVLADNTYCGMSIYNIDGQYTISWDVEDAIVTVNETPVENGDFLPYSMYGGYYITVVLPDYAAGTVNLTITPYVEVSGSGTFEDPYMLGAENTCAFPGGYNYVFYKYTAESAGTLTVTMTSADFYWGYGAGEYALDNVGSSTASADIALAAGESIWIGISTNSTSAGDVTFTSSFVATEGGSTEPVADGSFANPYALEADNSCAFPGGWNYVFYQYTAESAGTLTVTMTSADYYWAYGAGEYALDNVGSSTASADIALAAGETVYIGISTNSAEAATVTFTSSFAGGSDEVEEDEPLVLVLGENSVVVSADEAVVGAKEGTFVATVNGTYTFASNDVGVRIFDGDTMVGTGVVELEAGKTYTAVVLAMAEGTYTVTVTVVEKVVIPELELGSTQYNGVQNTYSYTASMDGALKLTSGAAIMGPVSFSYTVNGGDAVSFDVSSTVEVALSAGDVLLLTISGSGYSSITASFGAPITEVAGTITIGDNTYTLEANTYVAIPLAVDGTFVLTWSGAVVEYKASADADYVAITSGAEATLTADGGAALKVYLADYAAGTAVINVAVKEDSSEGGEDEGGSESTSIDGTYIGAGNNSRGMMVVIDTAADTLVITRAQSGSLTDFEGGTTYTLVYSETLAKADDTGLIAGTLTGTSIMNLTFDENGVVKSLVWSGATYTNYVKQ